MRMRGVSIKPRLARGGTRSRWPAGSTPGPSPFDNPRLARTSSMGAGVGGGALTRLLHEPSSSRRAPARRVSAGRRSQRRGAPPRRARSAPPPRCRRVVLVQANEGGAVHQRDVPWAVRTQRWNELPARAGRAGTRTAGQELAVPQCGPAGVPGTVDPRAPGAYRLRPRPPPKRPAPSAGWPCPQPERRWPDCPPRVARGCESGSTPPLGRTGSGLRIGRQSVRRRPGCP